MYIPYIKFYLNHNNLKVILGLQGCVLSTKISRIQTPMFQYERNIEIYMLVLDFIFNMIL